jgi:tetratricopeptide (TPR) repeat protein
MPARILSDAMRLTSSFAVFRFDPGEKDLAKARWFGREGKIDAAESEYRAALSRNADLASAWLELFELLRRAGRLEDALALAHDAREHFGPAAAMPLALQGAALVDLGRLREATRALEGALERDGNLALAWHETAYAAFRAGQYGRALLALDRAFALEPHVDTLLLRGRILRATGQYDAAVVAFEAAMQSAEHDIPRRDAEREIAATRRTATFEDRRPAELTARERVFADTGSVVLDDAEAPGYLTEPPQPAGVSEALAVLPAFAQEAGWRVGAVAGVTTGDSGFAQTIAQRLGVPVVAAAALDPADRPLLVTCYNDGGVDWAKQTGRLARWRGGVMLALSQAVGCADPADVLLTARPLAGADDGRALAQAVLALHDPQTPLPEELRALAHNAAAPWRARALPPEEAHSRH